MKLSIISTYSIGLHTCTHIQLRNKLDLWSIIMQRIFSLILVVLRLVVGASAGRHMLGQEQDCRTNGCPYQHCCNHLSSPGGWINLYACGECPTDRKLQEVATMPTSPNANSDVQEAGQSVPVVPASGLGNPAQCSSNDQCPEKEGCCTIDLGYPSCNAGCPNDLTYCTSADQCPPTLPTCDIPPGSKVPSAYCNNWQPMNTTIG